MIEYQLYDGEVTLCFEEKKHVYTIDDKKVESVTGILGVINKPALMGWAVKMTGEHLEEVWKPGVSYDEVEIAEMIKDAKGKHRKFSSGAASIGTMVHDFAEKYILKEPVELPVNIQARKNCKLFLDWYKKHHVMPIEAEFKLYSAQYHYAGTCDLDCIIDGKKTILDFKNSSGIYPEAHFQTAAYAQARQEELAVRYDQRMIVNFNKKTGNVEMETRNMTDDFVTDLSAFTGALNIRRALDSMK